MSWALHHGDCLAWLRELPSGSADSLVADPPAGIGFMGRVWDGDRGGRRQWIAWLAEVLEEARRVLKPGAHALVWALPRTSHWTGTALEDAGWEVRDQVFHLFGSGFPKSLDVSKALDKAAGAEREVVGTKRGVRGAAGTGMESAMPGKAVGVKQVQVVLPITAPATEAARAWDGWGTALKPAAEVWWLARVPLAGTVADTVTRYGVGGLNVDGCRVGTPENTTRPNGVRSTNLPGIGSPDGVGFGGGHAAGRWPPHVALTHAAACGKRCAPGCPVRVLDEQSGLMVSNKATKRPGAVAFSNGDQAKPTHAGPHYHGEPPGGASRFFPRFRYQAKPSSRERNAGCEHLPPVKPAAVECHGEGSSSLKSPRAGAGREQGETRNNHPTVKALGLMRWLCRLITPPGGVVLDPFAGSGSTGAGALLEGFRFLGAEASADYHRIACARLAHYAGEPAPPEVVRAKLECGGVHQLQLFGAAS